MSILENLIRDLLTSKYKDEINAIAKWQSQDVIYIGLTAFSQRSGNEVYEAIIIKYRDLVDMLLDINENRKLLEIKVNKMEANLVKKIIEF